MPGGNSSRVAEARQFESLSARSWSCWLASQLDHQHPVLVRGNGERCRAWPCDPAAGSGGTFRQVAGRTGERAVFDVVGTTLDGRDDVLQVEAITTGGLGRATVLAPASGTYFHTLAQFADLSLAHASPAIQSPLLLGEDPGVVQGEFLRFADQVLQFPLFLAAEFTLVVLLHEPIEPILLVRC